MSTGTGLGASLGFVKEASYGTFVAPTKFPEWRGRESIKREQKIVQGEGIAAGRLAPRASQRVIVANSAAGGIDDIEVSKTGMGQLLQQIFGTIVTPVQQAATAAYLQTIPFASVQGKSMSVQIGKEATDGTRHVFSYAGGKITEAEFTCAIDQPLLLKTSWDFKSESTTEAFATPSYPVPAEPSFDWSEMTVKTGTVGAETALAGVRSASLKVMRALDVERFNAGNSGAKDEPLENAWQQVTGQLEVEFRNLTDLHAKFTAGTSTALLLTWTGGEIAASYPYELEISVPAIFLDDVTYSVAGPEVIVAQVPFTGLISGSSALATCTYQSTDTAA